MGRKKGYLSPSNDSFHAPFTIVYTEVAEGGISGRCLELPGAISQGETLEELERNMTDAVQLILASIYEEAHEKKMEIEVSV
jgi:predicted RNase H-like HicB family nuclease